METILENLIRATAQLSTEVTQPFPNSRKLYVTGSRPDIRVPMREITQNATKTTTGAELNPPIYVYDTSGPYTDPEIPIDLLTGLPNLRGTWIEERDDSEPIAPQQPLQAKPGRIITQMHYARNGIITPEMEFVAIRERQCLDILRTDPHYTSLLRQHPGHSFGATLPEEITPEFVRSEIAAGRAIIPANINHPELEPMIIGRNFRVKINTNIGNSPVSSSITEEVEKMVWSARWGGGYSDGSFHGATNS